MKKTLFLILITGVVRINAQVCMSFGTDTLPITSPVYITSADFNGDGFDDLVTANGGANNISVLLSIGTGSFTPATNYAVHFNPWAITTNDFNGDGKIDIAVANQQANDVSILFGTGAGNFGGATNFVVGFNPSAIISGDFNGDAIIDLATICGNNKIGLVLGTGVGNFGASTTFTIASNAVSLTTSDFNGDGNLDLAVDHNGPSSISVLLGNGSGSFGPAVTFTTGTNSLFSLMSGDFNGDSYSDLAVSNFSGSSSYVSVCLGIGNGSFWSPTLDFTTGTGTQPRAAITSDFNGDGKPDFATANLNTGNISILLGIKTGNFNFTSPSSQYAGTFPASITHGDFNGDAKIDLAVTNNNSPSISIFLNCSPTQTCVASVTDSLYNVSPLNWNVIPHYSSQITSAIWNWGDGTFSNGLYPSHTYSIPDWYYICVTAYTSCGDSASTCRYDTLYKMANNSSMVNVNVVSTTTQTKQLLLNNKLNIYPNPTSDQFFIDANTSAKFNVDLYDTNGRHVFSKNVSDKSNINISTLDEGIYTLTIKTADSVTNKKLIILR